MEIPLNKLASACGVRSREVGAPVAPEIATGHERRLDCYGSGMSESSSTFQ